MSFALRLSLFISLLPASPLSAQEAAPASDPASNPAPNTTRLFIQGSIGALTVGAPVPRSETSQTFGFGRGLSVGYGFTPTVTAFAGFDFAGFLPPGEIEDEFTGAFGFSSTAATGEFRAGLRFNLPRAGSPLVPYADAGLAFVGTLYQSDVTFDDRDVAGPDTFTYGGVGAFGGLGLQIAVVPEVMVRVGGEVLATRYTVSDYDGDLESGHSDTLDDPISSLTGGLRVGVVAYPFR